MPDRQIFRSSFLILPLTAILFAVPVKAAPVTPRLESASSANPEQWTLWKSDHAKYLIGLTEVHPKAEGELVVTPGEVRFDSKGQHAVIPLETVIAVGVGNERVERGGLPFRLARMAMYDGSGAVFAAVLHHVVDLLTIEYRGDHGEYHGVVFVLPRNEATAALTQLTSLIQPPAEAGLQDEPSCTIRSAKLKSITVSPIATQLKTGELPVPPEYRVLLYEHVIQRLKGDSDLDNVYRFDTGQHTSECSEYSVEITVTAFKKGDNAVRASTGPLGIFLGTTVLAYDLRIRNADGHMVLERNIKSVVRGENESLDISGKIAKSITKAFVKVQKTHPEQPVPKPGADS